MTRMLLVLYVLLAPTMAHAACKACPFASALQMPDCRCMPDVPRSRIAIRKVRPKWKGGDAVPQVPVTCDAKGVCQAKP